MELSIDTSTDWGGIALSENGCMIAELIWHPGQNHTVELIPNIRRLVEIADIKLNSLRAIFVAKGPGSFNGLRAGLSAAKGLAFSLGVPLLGITTLEIEAHPFAFTCQPIRPLHDAGRGEIATALYVMKSTWQCLEEAHLTNIENLCTETKSRTVFCGEISEQYESQIKETLADNAIVPCKEERLRRPAHLAVLGWERFKSGWQDNAAALQPVYLRQPPITQRKKKY